MKWHFKSMEHTSRDTIFELVSVSQSVYLGHILLIAFILELARAKDRNINNLFRKYF